MKIKPISKLVSVILTLSLVLSAIPVSAFYNEDEPYILGDVNGDGVVDFLDALEITRFIERQPNVITDNPRALQAALISNPAATRPALADVREINNFLRGTASSLDNAQPGDGNNPERRWIVDPSGFATTSIRAEINVSDGNITYLTTEELSETVIYIDYTVADENDAVYFSPTGNSRLPRDSRSYFNFLNGRIQALIIIDGTIPADTWIMRQPFDDDPELFHNPEPSVTITGDGFTEITVNACAVAGCCGNHIIGDVNGDGAVDLLDLMEIMFFLLGRDSVFDTDPRALPSSLIRDPSAEEPNSDDALEILHFLNGTASAVRNANNPDREWIVGDEDFAPAPLRAEIDTELGFIYYYIDDELSLKDFFVIDYTISTTATTIRFSAPELNPRLDDDFWMLLSYNSQAGTAKAVIKSEAFGGSAPEEWVLRQEFSNVSAGNIERAHIINIASEGLTRIVLGCRIDNCCVPPRAPGHVLGEARISISDALEILKYLAKLEDTLISENEFAYAAASITADRPTINCALEILKHLAKLDSVLNV
jgi:hypothetical protein